MTVRHDFGARWEPNQGSNLSGRPAGEKYLEREVPSARDVPLPRITRGSGRSVELVSRSHVEENQILVADTAAKLVERYVFHCSRNSMRTALNRSGCSIDRR